MYDYSSAIPASVREEILYRLADIESEEEVRVFFACESGSRAWGFQSANSDYDVRFLYAHPIDWYLSIDVELKRDVIERPISDQLDISGWDLRKALGLFRKSNPPLLEWLGSPIVYLESGPVATAFRSMIPECYSPRSAFYHYLHMARGNFKSYLQADEVWTKKYFYILRPVLAVKWIEAKLGAVPMEFEVLVDRLVTSPTLKKDIDKLLAEKRSGFELDKGPRIESISAFIESELKRMSGPVLIEPGPKVSNDTLSSFFRESLEQLWGDRPVSDSRRT